MLGSPVLRSVGDGEMHGDAMAEEEGTGGGIIKFTPIIALNIFDGAAELGFNIGIKIRQCLEGVRFKMEWKGPKIV
jgi:hypothetical protein